MSGSFGSGGLGSFTVFPVELTCDFAGTSTVTESVTLVTQGTASFAGDSTVSFPPIVVIGVTTSMLANSAMGADAGVVDADALTFVGTSIMVIDNTKVIINHERPAILVGTAKPPVIPVIRINPPPVITHRPSIGRGNGRGRGRGTDRKPR